MDNAQLYMASLVVLVICLIVYLTSWYNYNNSKPVKAPADASDDQDNQEYWDSHYKKTADMAKIAGVVAAVGAVYFYKQCAGTDASCIWGGDISGGNDDYDGGLITTLGTPMQ